MSAGFKKGLFAFKKRGAYASVTRICFLNKQVSEGFHGVQHGVRNALMFGEEHKHQLRLERGVPCGV